MFFFLQSLQEMSQDYTDEAGKVIKGSNPFIEQPNQSNAVVDMKGNEDLFQVGFLVIQNKLNTTNFAGFLIISDETRMEPKNFNCMKLSSSTRTKPF